MLKVGQARCERLGYDKEMISWVKGDAEQLQFEDNKFNAYTTAFGVRNVTRIDKVCITINFLAFINYSLNL